jgi:hypothetical protein
MFIDRKSENIPLYVPSGHPQATSRTRSTNNRCVHRDETSAAPKPDSFDKSRRYSDNCSFTGQESSVSVLSGR